MKYILAILVLILWICVGLQQTKTEKLGEQVADLENFVFNNPVDTLEMIKIEWRRAKAALVESAIHAMNRPYADALDNTDSIYIGLINAWLIAHRDTGGVYFLPGRGK